MSILANSNAIESGGYNLERSLRFRSSASAYLNRTPASAGNRRTWTLSMWVKRGAISTSTSQPSLLAVDGSSDSTEFNFGFGGTTDTIGINGWSTTYRVTTQVFRDPSAWYHFVLAVDTTQATANNRIRLYVNGSEVTAFSTLNNPTQNFDLPINNNVLHYIGRQNTRYLDGYITEVNLIDGQALTPSSFGSTNATTGVWQPAKYTGTYGTNGFYLPFTDTSSTTNLVKDSSGNANNWTPNNISLTSGTTYDSMTDVPTLTSATAANYAVLNPLNKGTSVTVSNANLSSSTGAVWQIITSTAGITSGKYYFEAVLTSGTNGIVGIGTQGLSLGGVIGDNAFGYGYQSNGNKWNSNSAVAYGATWTTNDVIGIAYDADAGTITFYKNNVSQGVAYSGIPAGTYFFAVNTYSATMAANFGQRPFSYTPPTGFVALNTFNLPTPTILKGNTVMDASLWTGNNTANRTITNTAGFRPDLVWVKSRSSASWANFLNDSVRGFPEYLVSNSTGAAGTTSPNIVTSAASNGFVIENNGNSNNSGDTYVGWQWQAGQGTTSSNTSGSITSTVSVNATAGFSVVTYTGTGSAATIGHGLGVTPKMIIVKNRNDGTTNWAVYHASTGANAVLFLNSTATPTTVSGKWGTPSSTTFGVNTAADVNASTQNLVAYCWAEIAGFSKFGSYTGNGSADGPFVYTGFRPKFVMTKSASLAESWYINDSSRDTYNPDLRILAPSDSGAEFNNGSTWMDLTSNGFKIRYNASPFNNSGSTYIYMAFAENPFKNALAR